MKQLLILSFILSASFANAKTVARVLGVEGNSFNFMSSKKAKQLIYGSKIEDASVVMVEDGATLSIKDEAGRVYHLGGGTQVKLFSKLIEVQKGYIWVSSKLNSIGTISSANAVVKYTQGQFIFNFDNYRSKSQVMALTGNVQLSNSVEPELLVEIPAGHFSFIDNKIDEGMPRGATRVGLTSYKSFKSVFDNNERIQHKSFDRAFEQEQSVPKRAIASVTPKVTKGKILYFGKESKRIPASASPNAMSYYKSVTTPKKVVKKVKKVKIRVFGLEDEVSRGVASSTPESVKDSVSPSKSEGGSFFKRRQERMKLKEELELMKQKKIAAKFEAQEAAKRRKPSSVNPYAAKATAFEQSLKESESENTRHTNERSSLIDELKSYNKAYKKQY
jgi:hypothetical protein